ncbi:stage VI sporulation protein F [Paenibacillus oryzisoli]|uniref:stage VI sporulation protein F n=1 Tax=Paenibacillus oryzisoli TaxID=1850517 RepID=UPI003D2BC2D7
MANKDLSKDVLNVVKKKTGKSVTSKDIEKLASGVKPSTMQSETQLRQLIKQVSGLVNVKVSEETVNDIVQAVKSSKLDTNNMQQLMNMMLGKNK